MSRARQVDRNQAVIVAGLREAGVKVRLLHTVGEGIPDLLCGVRKRFYLLEVKDVGGSLEPKQEVFFDEFEGFPAFVVFTLQEALQCLGVTR